MEDFHLNVSVQFKTEMDTLVAYGIDVAIGHGAKPLLASYAVFYPFRIMEEFFFLLF